MYMTRKTDPYLSDVVGVSQLILPSSTMQIKLLETLIILILLIMNLYF